MIYTTNEIKTIVSRCHTANQLDLVEWYLGKHFEHYTALDSMEFGICIGVRNYEIKA